jgi:hypothetical protein
MAPLTGSPAIDSSTPSYRTYSPSHPQGFDHRGKRSPDKVVSRILPARWCGVCRTEAEMSSELSVRKPRCAKTWLSLLCIFLPGALPVAFSIFLSPLQIRILIVLNAISRAAR